MRIALDPACPDARALAVQHDQRASLLGGIPGSRLTDIVAEERVRAFREHQLLCARCLNYATPCARCARDGGKHAFLCREKWHRAASAPPRKRMPARVVAAKPPERSPFEVLGVPRDASAETLRRAYHERAMEYHPDRTRGLAPELRKIAEERMREINEAYRRASDGLL